MIEADCGGKLSSLAHVYHALILWSLEVTRGRLLRFGRMHALYMYKGSVSSWALSCERLKCDHVLTCSMCELPCRGWCCRWRRRPRSRI